MVLDGVSLTLYIVYCLFTLFCLFRHIWTVFRRDFGRLLYIIVVSRVFPLADFRFSQLGVRFVLYLKFCFTWDSEIFCGYPYWCRDYNFGVGL